MVIAGHIVDHGAKPFRKVLLIEGTRLEGSDDVLYTFTESLVNSQQNLLGHIFAVGGWPVVPFQKVRRFLLQKLEVRFLPQRFPIGLTADGYFLARLLIMTLLHRVY